MTVPFYRDGTDTGALLAPRFAVSYETPRGDLLYVTAAKGFRAGGTNVPECGTPPSYAPDDVSSYEVGTRDSVFSHRLRLTADVFYAEWNHIQELTSTTSFLLCRLHKQLGWAVSRGFDLTADTLLGERIYVEAYSRVS